MDISPGVIRLPMDTVEGKASSVSVPPMEDLAEVKKPTSLLVAQFFLFPLIIITICVGIFLLFGYLTYEQTSPREYLNDIRTGSDTRRWQAAFELSKIISTDKNRLRDTTFVHDVIALYRSSRSDSHLPGADVRGDPRVRRYLALSLGHLGDPRAVPALVDGLNDTDVESQIYALWSLGAIGDRSAVPGVLNRLNNDDPAVRKMAAYVLGALKDPSAVHALQVALNDATEDVRWNAAMSLAQLSDASGADVLVRLLDRGYLTQFSEMNDLQKNEIIVNAVKCLAIIKHEAARDTIISLSKNDPDLAVRDASIEALKSF